MATFIYVMYEIAYNQVITHGSGVYSGSVLWRTY